LAPWKFPPYRIGVGGPANLTEFEILCTGTGTGIQTTNFSEA
jgi:hypothetical protein